MRWLFASVLPLALTSCSEDPAPPAQQAPPAPEAPLEAALSDQDYLVRLGLIRGHLLVGHALYGLDALDAARSHSKHPTDELYAGMEREFAARQTTGFGDELETHARASQGVDGAAVETAYGALIAAIARAESVVDVSPTMTVDVIVELLREAAFEYGVGIVDGKLSNAHEYQDAYGFTQIALSWARGATPQAVFDRIVERIDDLSDMWPELVPPEEIDQKAGRLYGAAAEVEILGLALADRRDGVRPISIERKVIQ